VPLEGVRAQVAQIIGQGDEVGAGQIPFTPRAKKVLELSLREALSLGHSYIGTEHVLLGLARENEGVAARILLDFGADAETIRNQVVGMLPVTQRARVQFARRTQRRVPYAALLLGWALFGAALGVGILVGWAIWG
jgi:ATP-dependent Clp protease ATP-binding subunit ClpA